jgi:hypothetical protein
MGHGSGNEKSARETAALLHPDDLIDDRALASEDEDAFRLRDVVDEVDELCRAVPVPATLAIYGSWGSGKSSLANLLKARFASRKEIAFARFDAFKYAEVPLRRHFLSRVAAAFGVKDKEFSKGLYESSKSVKLRIPSEGWPMLLVFVFAAVLVTTLLAAVASFFVALVAKGGFWSDFTSALEASVPGIAIATPIVATAVALVGKQLSAETTTEAPSSEEQFEDLFRKLVKKIQKKTGSDRVVIFIDELDRCSAPQVVSALETLRTFLKVRPCVFIVAADQQVLEHALRDAPRQATPLNPANPYYSAGSAYLDKIFQYQLQLPPILPRRLSRFALDLIDGREGLWTQIPNRAELVSVLVPTHVRSPRRVKALLNSFALLYRLALKRAAEEAIDHRVEERASEIGKLVCLKTEFPIFAADLQLDHRLPALVLQIRQDGQVADDDLRKAFVGVSPSALARARGYAKEDLPVDEVIAQPALAEEAIEQPADEEETEEAHDVGKSHAKQLIRYLERTSEIANPGRDLIYLESPGAAFGLPAELAESLEQDAVDGRVDAVAEAFGDLDDQAQENVFRLLAWLIVEAVGIEARNVASSLFGAIAVRKGELTPVAAELLTSTCRGRPTSRSRRSTARRRPGSITVGR